MLEKALNRAPSGLEDLLNDGPEIEIEIEDPESVSIHADGLDIEMGKDHDIAFDDNLADFIGEQELLSIATELIGDFDSDLASRKEWMQTYVDGLELLGLKIEERTEPWEGACGVFHPLLAEALVKFQAETMMSTFPAAGPVKTQIVGKETQAKKEAAERVQNDMNYQLMDVMKEYRPEHERMLWGLGLAGNAFKKVYYDPHMRRQVSMFAPAEDVVVPYGASSLESAPRITHVMRKTENELRRLQVAGFYRDVDLGHPDNILDEVEKKIAEKLGFRATSDDRYKVLEIHVDLDLPGFEDVDKHGEPTGIALPYIVTIEKGTTSVLAVRRNWSPDDPTKAKRQHFVHYGYVPGFGFYHFGLIHLIGAFAKSGTSLIRQLVDAGTLSNLPGGFKTRGLRVKGDDTPIAPGEFRDVDVPSGSIKDNLLPLPYKEPSQVLMALLNQIVEDGRRFANTADLQISDMSGQSPVGTTLAILERTLKVTTAIQARIYYSMQQELGLLKEIIADYTPEDYDYDPEEGSRKAKKSDYHNVDVIPVADPNASTMAQKIVQYQAVLQLASQAPQLYNMPLLHKQMLDVLGIKDVNKLIPMAEDQAPTDPVTENQNALVMKPLKAFSYQDHQAHITVHMSAMQDPKTQQLLQSNPQAPLITQALMAHINEHIGFEYRVQIEQQLGFALPPQTDESGEQEKMDPKVEAQLAPLLAQAAQRLLQQSQGQAAQQQAQQQAQDPIIQMQQQELQLKAQAQQQKAQMDAMQLQIKQQQLQIEQMRIQSQQQVAMAQNKSKQQIAMAQTASKHMLGQQANEIGEKKIHMEAASKVAEIKTKKHSDSVAHGVEMAKQYLADRTADTRAKDELVADGMKSIMQVKHQERMASKKPKGE